LYNENDAAMKLVNLQDPYGVDSHRGSEDIQRHWHTSNGCKLGAIATKLQEQTRKESPEFFRSLPHIPRIPLVFDEVNDPFTRTQEHAQTPKGNPTYRGTGNPNEARWRNAVSQANPSAVR